MQEQSTRLCSVEGCAKPSRTLRSPYCHMHYMRLYRHGVLVTEKRWASNGGRCSIDGCERPPRSPASPYCEMHYYRLRRSGQVGSVESSRPTFTHCAHCGKPTRNGGQYCSVRCSTRARRGNPAVSECVACGRPFHAVSKRLTCSPACQYQQARSMAILRYRTNPTVRDRALDHSDRRKRIKNATRIEPIARYEVFEADGWLCQLCGEFVDRGHQWPHPLSPSLDHIIPLARGGTHTLDNVQCSHLRCNLAKHMG